MRNDVPESDIYEMAHCPDCGARRDSKVLNCSCGAPSHKGLWKSKRLMSTYIEDTEHGLGVFASCDIPGRTLIESAPVYVVSTKKHFPIDDALNKLMHRMELECGEDETIFLGHMLLRWLEGDEKCIVTGNGMLYNHDWTPNCWYWPRHEKKTNRYFIDYFTMKSVVAGEELKIYYGEKVWFPPYVKQP